MDAPRLPPEMIWEIVDHVKDLPTRKSLSLVSTLFHNLVFCTKNAQQHVNLRITPGYWNSEQTQRMFDEVQNAMSASNRRYVNIEFSLVDFAHPAAKNVIRFILDKYKSSIKRLKIISCFNFSRQYLLEILSIPENLTELHLHSFFDDDENAAIDVIPLTKLEIASIYIKNNSLFFEDLYLLAPNLEDLRINILFHETRQQQYRENTAISRFGKQLKRLSISSKQIDTSLQFMQTSWDNLVELELLLNGVIELHGFRNCKQLRSLTLDGIITDQTLDDIGQMSTLEKLSLHFLFNPENISIHKLNSLPKLKSLEIHRMRHYTWAEVELPELEHLHVDALGDKWYDFIKQTKLVSYGVHQQVLTDLELRIMSKKIPSLKRFELNICSNVTDEGLQRLRELEYQGNLRVTSIDTTRLAYQDWDYCEFSENFTRHRYPIFHVRYEGNL